MLNSHRYFLMGFLALGANSFARAAENCKYVWDSSSGVQLEWTAFKTSQKLPVKGKFERTLAQAATESPSVADWINSATFSIDPRTVSTGDVGRNATLVSAFFLKEGTQWMRGYASAQGSAATVYLRWGTHDLKIPMQFEYGADGVLRGTGTLDLLKVGLKAPWASLHEACKELHKGKDGVSKTWSEVDLQVSTPLKKVCDS